MITMIDNVWHAMLHSLLPVLFQMVLNGPVTDVLSLMLSVSTSSPNMWYQKRM